MARVPAATARAFVAAGREVASAGLVRCSSGNLSLRLDRGRMLIKASRAWMGRMTDRDVSVCRIVDGARLAGPSPSVEIGFHAGVLRSRPDVNVVLHVQPPFATTLACRRGDPDPFVIPEIPFYIGPVGRVPYRLPGSESLAEAVVEAMRTHNLVVMENHGLVTAARSLDHAIQNAAFFELACQIRVLGGPRVRPLPEREAKALLLAGHGRPGKPV